MKFVSGKLYETLREETMVVNENYDKNEEGCSPILVNKGFPLLFIKQRKSEIMKEKGERGVELVFLYEGQLVVLEDWDDDINPQRFLKEI